MTQGLPLGYLLVMEKVILTTAYLGPIQYYTKFLASRNVQIEQYDSYQKQTYRNRCRILGANGPLDLTIPVIKISGEKTLVKDVKIDYSTRWQSNHWRSIVAAYNSSPFFEYLEADFNPFYEKEWKYLIDFNLDLHAVIADIFELQTKVKLTTDFISDFEGNDFRTIISPKRTSTDQQFSPQIYSQTFGDKFGFVPNLSIIDLLFNCGSEAEMILDASIVR